MLNKLKKNFVYVLRTWRVKANDSVDLELPYGIEGDIEKVEMTGRLYKAFTDVELDIYFVKQWPDEILILFYAAVIEMYRHDALTEANMRMFLHPEAYEQLEFDIEDQSNEENNTVL